MKIGAEALVESWGRPMELERNGVVIVSFKGRMREYRPDQDELTESVNQHNFIVIGTATAFGAIRPVKFDVVIYNGERFTVQRGHVAGADEDELIKMTVRGGQV